MSSALASCAKLHTLTLYLPFDTALISRLAHSLAPEAPDTRARRRLSLSLVFEMYPGCVAPTADDWRSLDAVLQTPVYKLLGRVTIGQLSKIIPEKSEMVWGNIYPSSKVSNQVFKEELKTLLPRTYERRLLWWWHPLDPSCTTSVQL